MKSDDKKVKKLKVVSKKFCKLILGVLLITFNFSLFTLAEPPAIPPAGKPNLSGTTAPLPSKPNAPTSPMAAATTQPAPTPPAAQPKSPVANAPTVGTPKAPTGATSGQNPDQANDQSQAAASPITNENGEELVYLNVQDADIKEVIKQISKATGRNFIMDDKVRGKVTILSERPMTREEAYQTFLSSLGVAGFTVVKGPAGVLKVVPLKDAIREPIPTHVDSTPVTDMFITRLIPLQNISATDMSNAISALVSPEGKLFAYPMTNTLILTDSGTNIDRLMKIIKELDQEGPQQVMEIIPIVNTSAKDVSDMVNQLFEQQKNAGATKAKKPGEMEEMAEVSKIIPDDRTNSLIVLASRRAMDKVRNIIQRLDRKLDSAQEGKIHVFYLKHAKAKTMAETLSTLTQGAGTKKDAKTGASAGPTVAEFEGGMKITADELTNSLIITASAKDYQTLLDKVISKLDIPRRQVYLEAIVMELSVNKGADFGVSGYGGGSVGPTNIIGTGPGGATLLSSFLAGTAPAFPAGMLGGLLGRDSVPITIGNETKTIPSMGLFFSALATYGDANIVSSPSILTMDNEEAKIEIKGKQYYKSSLVSTTGTQFSAQANETGLILKITPQIGEGDNISLKIEQSLSDISGAQTDPTLPSPTKERSIKTSVVTKESQTVILGGLMEDKMQTAKTKIPLLGDIPILGNLFKMTSTQKSKVNLLVFITPHILKDPSDFSAILKKKLEDRNKFIDDNYGRKQRNAIRDSIRSHREDLLEYKEETPKVEPQKKPVLPPSANELGETTSSTVPPVSKPVITVPQSQPAPQPAVQPAQKTPPQTKTLATVKEQPAEKQPTVKSTPSPADKGRVKAPVINVPPPAPGQRKDELDLAY